MVLDSSFNVRKLINAFHSERSDRKLFHRYNVSRKKHDRNTLPMVLIERWYQLHSQNWYHAALQSHRTITFRQHGSKDRTQAFLSSLIRSSSDLSRHQSWASMFYILLSSFLSINFIILNIMRYLQRLWQCFCVCVCEQFVSFLHGALAWSFRWRGEKLKIVSKER
jgi:hypothetical protein